MTIRDVLSYSLLTRWNKRAPAFSYYLAWLYATAKNKSYRNGEKTVIFALKAINLQKSAKCIDTLGAAYVENKQHEKAIETVKQIVKYHPDYKEDLAALYLRTERYDEALVVFEEALKSV